MKYFLDESGNSGDLVSKKWTRAFSDQPFFVLTSIAIDRDSENKIISDIEKILINNDLEPTDELKSSSNKKGMYHALIEAANLAINCHHIVEIVEKKYMLCMSITRHFFSKINNSITTPEKHILDREVCENLYTNLTDNEISVFIDSCINPSIGSARDFIKLILKNKSINRLIRREIIGNYNFFKHQEENKFISHYFPTPDHVNNKTYHLLPNLSSITAITARINKYHLNEIKDVILIHDDQHEYGDIFLANIENQIKNTESEDIEHIQGVNYKFTEEFKQINFEKSNNKIIQLSDTLSGFISRCFKSIKADRNLPEDFKYLFLKLNEKNLYPNSPLGINFYVSDAVMSKLNKEIFHIKKNDPRHQKTLEIIKFMQNT